MHEPRVSIILPVYNSEKYLKRCVESILAQTFTDLEAVFVDDASSDGSLALLKSYADADSRIRIIKLGENIGQGGARNIGIESSRGKYLSFVDSDDMIEPDFIELLYKKAEKTGAQIVKGSALRLNDTAQKRKANTKYNRMIREELSCGTPLIVCFRSEHWSAVYRRDFVMDNSIRYGSSRVGQDSTFLLKACTYAQSFETEDAAVYCYFQNEGSIIHRFDELRFKGTLDAFEEQLEFIASSELSFDDRVQYVEMNARIIMGLHAYMLSEGLPAADAFAKRFLDLLMRFDGVEELKKRQYGIREFIDSLGKANIDPVICVIGLKDNLKVRADTLKRLKEHLISKQDKQ